MISQIKMVMEEDIVIVGAGIAGLTTSLALHRYAASHTTNLILHIFFFMIALMSTVDNIIRCKKL